MMSNFRIFGHPIHDTALIIIGTTTVSTIFWSLFSEIGRIEANLCILSGFTTGFLYWFTQYKIKK